MNRRLPLIAAALGLISSLAVGQTTTARSDDAGKVPDSAGEIRQWLSSFDRAFESLDVSRLERFYDDGVTIFEGSVTNTGWADYRDNHIGKELAEMSEVSLSHKDVAVRFLDGIQTWACVTSRFSLSMIVKGEKIDLLGLETLVIRKVPSAGWKIVHSHTSARRALPEPPSPEKK